jgi:hypothetical protein
VVDHHVPKGADLIVVTTPQADSVAFRHGDLHVVDVVAIPDRLEDPIRQAKRKNVLDGLFAQIVVDAVDLRFLEDLLDLAIELAGAGQVGPEGFFNHDARKGVLARRAVQADGSQVVDDAGKQLGRCGEIEEPVTLRTVVAVELSESRC